MKNLNIEEYDCVQMTVKEKYSTDGGLILAGFVFGIVVGLIFGFMLFDWLKQT